MCFEIVERVRQLLAGVHLELLRDVHVLGALEHLRVHDVGDDRLVLAGEIFVEPLDELLPGDGFFARCAGIGHVVKLLRIASSGIDAIGERAAFSAGHRRSCSCTIISS